MVMAAAIPRLWASRPLRLAWTAAVVLLVCGHGVVSLGPESPPAVAHKPAPGGGAVAELDRDVVELPRIRPLAEVLGGNRPGAAAAKPTETTPSNRRLKGRSNRPGGPS